MVGVLDYIGVPRVSLYGYDWGGGIALSTAATHTARVDKLILFHPTFSIEEAKRLRVNRLRQLVLVLQVKVEQFHPIASARQLMKQLPASAIFKVLSCGRYTAEKPANCYQSIAEVVISSVKTWLQDTSRTVRHRQGVKGESTAAVFPLQSNWTRFTITPLTALSAPQAVAMLAEAIEEDRLESMYASFIGRGNNESFRGATHRLFHSLPCLSPTRLHHPQQLVDAGLWSAVPPGWDNMVSSPRYFPGRQLLVEAQVAVHDSRDPVYMALLKETTRGARLFMCVSGSPSCSPPA